MIFKQFTQDDLSCASYMVGDGGEVAIVDPKFEIDDYLEYARYVGVEITHVLETHNHADHVSGHGRLAAATGATIHVHELGNAEYDHESFTDGWELRLGDLVIRAIHTPGHRPEHTAFELIDTSRSETPWAVLTGDTLFVGDVARPDLAIDKTDGARDIFHSLRERILTLPGETEVWPGHLGGSMCGSSAMNPKISSTIGYELRANEMLSIADEERFVEESIARIGEQPPNFKNIVAVNRGPLLTERVTVQPLTARQIERRVADGAFLVDVRTALQFDDAHIEDATCITMLQPGFGSKLAWLADPDREIVFVGRDDADGQRAVLLAQAVGLRRLGGFLHGGMTAWHEEGRPAVKTARLTLEEMKDLHDNGGGELQIVDVREADEWEDKHIPGSVHIPWHDIDSFPSKLKKTQPIAAICGSGKRSGVAASLLQRFGAERVIHVTGGGVSEWEQLGGDVESA